MGIGGCIILIAIGAIVTFATDWHAKGVNLDLLGLIMMAVGMIGLAAYVSIFKRRMDTPDGGRRRAARRGGALLPGRPLLSR